MDEIIDIVDSEWKPTGEIIGKNIAHRGWVLHRVAHVHIYDNKWNIYFQKRSQSRKHFPWMLHFAIWWHVWAGEDVLDAAIREWEEEVWLSINRDKLDLIGKFHQNVIHKEYGLHDNEIAYDYIYSCDWKVDEFVFEDWEVESIEFMHIDELLNIPFDQYAKLGIVPYMYYPIILEWIKKFL